MLLPNTRYLEILRENCEFVFSFPFRKLIRLGNNIYICKIASSVILAI